MQRLVITARPIHPKHYGGKLTKDLWEISLPCDGSEHERAIEWLTRYRLAVVRTFVE